jgi:hypothetical protein
MQMTEAVPRSWSDKYPPRTHLKNELSTVDIEIRHGAGVIRLDPNSSLLAAYSEKLVFGPTCTPSILSGEPGYLYRNDAVELALTEAEIYRLFRFNLRPEEFLKLAQTVGIFYEISGKFYDEDSCIALTPRFSFAEQVQREKLSKHPHLFVVADRNDNLWPHSILGFELATECREDFAKRTGVLSFVVTLEAPERAGKLSPFDNIVALHIAENGEMHAYGPFEKTDTADAYRPAGEGTAPARRIITATVNSVFIQ